MLYMVTFTINIPQMLAYIPYMDPMGYIYILIYIRIIYRDYNLSIFFYTRLLKVAAIHISRDLLARHRGTSQI